MPNIEHLRALGREIDRQRRLKGIKRVKDLAELAELSPQRLSEIIKGYQNPNRGFAIPTDEVLERLADALEMPVARFHALLGRFPDHALPGFKNADTMNHAEAYDQLPDFARKMMQDVLKKVQDINEIVASEN